MIRRVRFRAPLYIAWGLFFLAWTIAARATTPVLESHMREFVYWTIGVVIFSLVGAGGAFVSYLNARMERSFERAIGRLEKNVEDLGEMLRSHHLDPLAHPIGSANRLDPINEKLDVLHDSLTQLLTEHRIIRGSEDEVCMLVRSLAQKRDPMESAATKRHDDTNGLDHRPERGKP
mgnify:CR=1 FL=1